MERRNFLKTLGGFAALAISWPTRQAKRAVLATPLKHIPGMRYWAGAGTSNDWNDPRNWAGGHVPQNGDSVTFHGPTPFFDVLQTRDGPPMTLDTVVVLPPNRGKP